ncbi:MAG: YbaB/EbfC family nucleoid-associated protein [Phycicoccus sp.]
MSVNGLDPGQLLAQEAQELWEKHQRQMEELHRTLQERAFTGTAADGMITATVRASGGVTAIDIDPYVIQRYGVEGLGDMVMRAIADASRQSAEMMREVFEQFLPEGYDGMNGAGPGGPRAEMPSFPVGGSATSPSVNGSPARGR